MSAGLVVVVARAWRVSAVPTTSGGPDFEVTVDRAIGSAAARVGNGGWLCPAQAGPLPEPGLTLYGLRAMFNADSPLYFSP